MSNYDLGSAEGRIVIDASGVESAVGGIENQMGRLRGQTQNTGQVLQDVGRPLMAIGGLAVGAFGLAIKSASDFEFQISAIEAVAQGTEEQMERVRETALRLGADTTFSAGEAAMAMEELARRGIGVEDILNGAADAAVNLAAATGTDLVTAATVASNAMNIFGLSAEDLGNVTDKIAGFDVVGSSVEDFSYAMSQAGAVANLVGLSFDDTTLAIAALSKAGINGSDAGTSLKTMLNNLQPTTKKQIKLARELGILTDDGANAFYNEAGQIRSMSEIAEVLHTSMAGLTDQQKQMALETLFGSDSIRAAAVIAEQGAAGFDELAQTIGAVSAEDQAATRMDNLAGSIEQLKGSIETYLIGAGTPFLDSVRDIIDGITGLVNWFGNLPGPVQELISKFILFAGIAFLVAGSTAYFLGTFIKFAQALKAFTGLFQLAKGATTAAKGMQALNLAFLANPIFLIIVAVIALVAAFVILYKRSEKFRKLINRIGEEIQKIWGAVKDFFANLPEFFSNLWDDIVDTFNNAVEAVGDAISSVGEWFADLGETIWDAITGAIDAIVDFGAEVIDAFVEWLTELPGVIADGLSTALDTFVDFLVELPERAAYWLGFLIGRWIRFHIDLIQLVVQIGIDVIKAVVDFMTQLPGRVWDFLTAAFNMFRDFAADVLSLIIGWGTEIITFLINKFTEFITWLPGFIADVVAMVIGWGVDMVSAAVNAGISLVTGLINAIVGLPGQVFGILQSIVSGFPGFAGNFFSNALNIGTNIVSGLVGGIGDLAGLIKDMILGAINGIGNLGTTAYNKMKDVGKSMWNGFKDGLFGSPHTKVEYAVWDMTDNVNSSIKTLGQQVRQIQGLSYTLPGVDTTTAMAPGGSRAMAGVAASTAAVGSPASSTGLTVQGPLLHVDRLNGTEEEALQLSRKLADLTYKQLEAQGNRSARVNGAFDAQW